MYEELAFQADEFMAMPLTRRAELCAQLAQRAQALAALAQPPLRLHYLVIAKEWLQLASATEREITAAKR